MIDKSLGQVQTLDLEFLGLPGAIAIYMIPHAHGAVLVECGPSSTLAKSKSEIEKFGLNPTDITDVLLTHIHLDHAGAAGWWAAKGAKIHVHPAGAPHLAEPEKLLSSARRIYGDKMDILWGEFLPVPPENLIIHKDQDDFEIEGLVFKAFDTPGHAYHHFVYIFENLCFSGDIGGIRLNHLRHLRLPMPPPEFNLELWRDSIQKLIRLHGQGIFQHIAPTHFGIFDDAGWHLNALDALLTETENWITSVMPEQPDIAHLNDQFLAWTEERSQKEGISIADRQAYEAANPSWMSGAGVHRYWHKVRSV